MIEVHIGHTISVCTRNEAAKLIRNARKSGKFVDRLLFDAESGCYVQPYYVIS